MNNFFKQRIRIHFAFCYRFAEYLDKKTPAVYAALNKKKVAKIYYNIFELLDDNKKQRQELEQARQDIKKLTEKIKGVNK